MKNALILHYADKLSVEIAEDARESKTKALRISRSVLSVCDTSTQSLAASALRDVQALAKAAETSRVEVKQPVLEIGRKIDKLAADYVADLNTEVNRLKKLVADYQNEQERIRLEAERKKQEELWRIEREAQALREAEAKRIAEAARLEEEKQKAWEAEFLAESPEQVAAAEKAKAELERQAVEAASRAKAAQLEAEALAKKQYAASQQIIPTAHKPAGMSVKETWKFEVLNLEVLHQHDARLVRMEANASAINEALRNGIRQIPGLRIYSEKAVGVRS